MKYRLLFALLVSSLFASAMLVLSVSPVLAESQSVAKPPPTPPPLPPTSIFLSNLDTQNLGTPFNLTGTLITVGKPVPNTSVVITIDGKFLGQTSTDDNGLFQFGVRQDLLAGSYVLSANFLGTRFLAPSTVSVPLQIRPAEVVIQTVPSIAGITFVLGGQQFISAANGLAKVSISKVGTYHLVVQTDKYNNSTQRISFGRWMDENFAPSRDVQVPTNGPLQVGFDVYNKVDQTFVDMDGNPFDPKRVSGISIKSAQGDIFNYLDGQQLWVPASRINRRSSGLEITNLLYSVISVTVDGSNVVNKAQQRFYTGIDKTWKISLILFSIGLTAKDALFGSPVGEAATVLYPNGVVESYSLDKAGVVKLPSLARGIYKIQLTGTNGINPLTPVALSRNQVINENVITYLDLGVIGGFGLLIALGLIFFGRPWLLFPHMKRLELDPAGSLEGESVYFHDN